MGAARPATGIRVLELFAGIGGAAAALDGAAEVVAAVDIHRTALDLYRRRFPHPTVTANLVGLSAARLRRFGAELWWMSPPCQPYTRRGLRRDDADPRARPLAVLTERIAELRPPLVALENVPGFATSRSHRRLRATLDDAGYAVRELELCPSQLGIPNRRRRFYLVASRCGLAAAAPPPSQPPRPLAAYLDPRPAPELTLDPAVSELYPHALHRVSADDPRAVTSCFTAAYGRSPVRSGSYLRLADGGLRRFSPGEILRLLGFARRFELPAELPLATAWRLAGNSLSVPAVRTALAALPGLEGLAEAPSEPPAEGPTLPAAALQA